MSDPFDLAEWLRDVRLDGCEHEIVGMEPKLCSPCLRELILTSHWLARARIDAQIAILTEMLDEMPDTFGHFDAAAVALWIDAKIERLGAGE